MASLVQSSATLTPNTANDYRQVFDMSDSRILVIYGAAGSLHYKTSTDGLTWGSAGSISAAGTPQACVQNGDTLYLLTLASGTLTVTVLAYSAGTLTGTAHALGTGPASMLGIADAVWDSGHSVLHLAINPASSGQMFIGAWNPSSPATIPAWLQCWALSNGSYAVVNGMTCVPGSPSSILITLTQGPVFVLPVLYAGSYTVGGAESPPLPSGGRAAAALDASNLLDIVYVQSGAVYAVKRPGTGIYNTARNLVPSGASGPLSLVTSGSDLVVFFETVINQANGEIYLVWRQGATWGSPKIVAGGDASGYTNPKTASGLTAGRYDLVYQKGADVEYGAGVQGSAPDTPVVTAPSGATGSLAPRIAGTYSNSTAPQDLQGAAEYRVVRTSDSVVMWDSGKVTDSVISRIYGTGSNVSDPNYVAPTALAYGVQYAVQVRVWDSVLLPAQVSGWSTGVTFTPYQAGTTALTHVVQDGIDSTSAPVTIDSPTITGITGSWSQPQSHGADQVKATLYEPDLTTVVATLPAASIPGGLASGSSDTIGPWTIPGLANHSTYYLVLSYRDSVSLLWNDSAPWEIDTAWTPPPAPTLFTAIPQPQNGVTVLSWGNQGVYVSVVVQRALAGTGNWETLPKAGLFMTLTDWPKLEVAYDYRVYGIDASGTESTPATATNVRLAANGIYGVWVTDSIYPAVQTCFGVVDQWEDATKLEHPDDSVKWRPLGGSKVIISFSLQDYAHGQRVFLVPTMGPDATGTILDQDLVVATLLALRKAHNPCLYRDIKGRFLYVALESPSDATANDKHPLDKVTWEMTEVQGVDGPLVV